MKKHFSLPPQSSQPPPLYVGGGGVHVGVGGAHLQQPTVTIGSGHSSAPSVVPQMSKIKIMAPPPVPTNPATTSTRATTVADGAPSLRAMPPQTAPKNIVVNRPAFAPAHHRPKKASANQQQQTTATPVTPNVSNSVVHVGGGIIPSDPHHVGSKGSTGNNNKNKDRGAITHASAAPPSMIAARPILNLRVGGATITPPSLPATGNNTSSNSNSNINNNNNSINNKSQYMNNPAAVSSSPSASAGVGVGVPYVVPAVTSASTVAVTKPSHQVLLIKPLPAFLTEDSALLALGKSFVLGANQNSSSTGDHINYLPYAAKVVRNTVLSAVTAAQLTANKNAADTNNNNNSSAVTATAAATGKEKEDEEGVESGKAFDTQTEALLQAAIDRQKEEEEHQQQQQQRKHFMPSRECFCEEGYGFLLFATEDAGLTYLRAVHAAAAAANKVASLSSSSSAQRSQRISAPARIHHGMRPHVVSSVRKDFNEIKAIQNQLYAEHTKETIAAATAAASPSSPLLAHHLIHINNNASNNSNNKAVPPATRLTAAALHQQGKQLAAVAAANLASTNSASSSSQGPTCTTPTAIDTELDDTLTTGTRHHQQGTNKAAVDDSTAEEGRTIISGDVTPNTHSSPCAPAAPASTKEVSIYSASSSPPQHIPPPVLAMTRSHSYTSSISSSSCDSATSFDSNSTSDAESCVGTECEDMLDNNNNKGARRGSKLRAVSASSAEGTTNGDNSSSSCVHCTHHRRLYRIYYRAKMNKLLEKAHVQCSVIAGEEEQLGGDGKGMAPCSHHLPQVSPSHGITTASVAPKDEKAVTTTTTTPQPPSTLAAHIESMRALFSGCFFNTTISPAGVDGTVTARPKVKTLALKGCAFGNKTRVGRVSAAAALNAPAPAKPSAALAADDAHHNGEGEGEKKTSSEVASRTPSISVGGKPQPPACIPPTATTTPPIATTSSYVHLPSSSIEATAAMAKGIAKLIPTVPPQQVPECTPAAKSLEEEKKKKGSEPSTTSDVASATEGSQHNPSSPLLASPPRTSPSIAVPPAATVTSSASSIATTASRFAEAVASSDLFTKSVMTIQKPLIIQTIRPPAASSLYSATALEDDNSNNTKHRDDKVRGSDGGNAIIEESEVGANATVVVGSGGDSETPSSSGVVYKVTYGESTHSADVYNFNDAFDQAMAMLIKRNAATSANTTAYKAEAALPLATRHHTHHRHCVIHRQQASNRRSERRRQKNLIAKIASRVQHTPHVVTVAVSPPQPVSNPAVATISSLSSSPSGGVVVGSGPISVVVGVGSLNKAAPSSAKHPQVLSSPPAYGAAAPLSVNKTLSCTSSTVPCQYSTNKVSDDVVVAVDYSKTYALEELLVASRANEQHQQQQANYQLESPAIGGGNECNAHSTITNAAFGHGYRATTPIPNVNANNPFLCSIYATPTAPAVNATAESASNNCSADDFAAVGNTHCEEVVAVGCGGANGTEYLAMDATHARVRSSNSVISSYGSSIIIIPNAASAVTPNMSTTPGTAQNSSSSSTPESFMKKGTSANSNSGSVLVYSSSSSSSNKEEGAADGRRGAGMLSQSSSSALPSSSSSSSGASRRYRYNPYGDRGLEAFQKATEQNRHHFLSLLAHQHHHYQEQQHQQQHQLVSERVSSSVREEEIEALTLEGAAIDHSTTEDHRKSSSSRRTKDKREKEESEKESKKKKKTAADKGIAANGDDDNGQKERSKTEKKRKEKREEDGEEDRDSKRKKNKEKKKLLTQQKKDDGEVEVGASAGDSAEGRAKTAGTENAVEHQPAASSYYSSIASYIPTLFASPTVVSSTVSTANTANHKPQSGEAQSPEVVVAETAPTASSSSAQGGAQAHGIAAGAARLIGGVGLKDVANGASTKIRNMLVFSKVKRF